MGKESYHSKMTYGTSEFPFAFFYDEADRYKQGVIGWHWHDEIEFIYVLSDHVICSIGADQFELHAGDGMFINHSILHRFEICSSGKMLSLVFLPRFIASPKTAIFSSFIQPVLEANLYYQFLSNDDPEHSKVLKKIYAASQAIQEDSKLRELNTYIAALDMWRTFYICFIDDKLFPKRSKFIKTQNRIQLMIDFIEMNYTTDISVEDIAGAANISKSEAGRCFDELLRVSPLKYLNSYRLSVAVKLICETEEPISMIASAVGFNSNTYFTRLFHKQYGMTPIQMRNQ